MKDLYSEIVAEAKLRSGRKNPLFRAAGILLLSLLLAAAVGASALSYAWISRNRTVTEKGVAMRYDADALNVGGIKLDDDSQVVTLVDAGDLAAALTGQDTMIPGSVLTLKIGLVNPLEGEQTVTSLGFQTTKIWAAEDGGYDSVDPDAYDEIPSLIDGEYYYLGTQLTVEANRYTVYEYEERQVYEEDGTTPKLDENGQPVVELHVTKTYDPVTLSEMTPVRMTSVDGSAVSYASCIRDDLAIDLPKNHLVAFDIVVTFVNEETEQNAYRNFGTGKAKFSRTVKIDMTAAEP